MNSGWASLEWVAISVAAVVGLFVGSFLNVVVYRIPLGLSVSRPRSFCPTCDRQLAWWENVPLVSWLALGGKCSTCHETISGRYPLVEAITAATFAFVTWAWSGSLLASGYCVLAATSIAVALIEFGGKRSPLSVAASGLALGGVLIVAASLWLSEWTVLVGSLFGLVIGTTAYALSRMRDPDCHARLGRGRSLLPVAGCWLGGLGAGPAAAGIASVVVTAAVCIAVAWQGRHRSEESGPRGQLGGRTATLAHLIVSVPTTIAILLALTVSLAVTR